MTRMDALAESMLPRALDLVVQVHDREPLAARGLLAELDWQRLAALCVVLAALVPDDRNADELLAWTHEEQPFRRPRVAEVAPWQAAAHRARLAMTIGLPVDDYEPRSA